MFDKPLANPRNRRTHAVSDFIQRAFIEQKLNNWLGYLLFIGIAVLVGYLMAQQPLLGMGLIAITCGLAVMMVCLLHTEAGLYINMVYSFFAFHISRLFFHDMLQVGVFSDLLIFATAFGLLLKKEGVRTSFSKFSASSVVIVLLLVYGYTAIELFNPYAKSFSGWFLAFRKSLGTFLLLFTAYNVFVHKQQVKRYITVLFVLCAFAGLYGCIQEWHGLFDFERAWITSDPHRFGLYYIDGDFRKFSTMSDPAAYAILMAACSIFFTILASGLKGLAPKLILLTGVLFMVLGMSYSGTRTANAMIAGGLAIFILLTINKRSTQVLAVISFVLFLAIMYGPFYNPTVSRFRSTFYAKNDASFNVREINRKRIQPYIYSHPIGGGLATTGATGEAFNPGHTLAGFPPDSGYLKKALEMGWIGLSLFCILYFLVLKRGVNGYFICKNEKLKLVYAGCTAALFSFYLADYSQVAIGQITDIVVYYPFIAILLKLQHFDEPNQALPHENNYERSS